MVKIISISGISKQILSDEYCGDTELLVVRSSWSKVTVKKKNAKSVTFKIDCKAKDFAPVGTMVSIDQEYLTASVVKEAPAADIVSKMIKTAFEEAVIKRPKTTVPLRPATGSIFSPKRGL